MEQPRHGVEGVAGWPIDRGGWIEKTTRRPVTRLTDSRCTVPVVVVVVVDAGFSLVRAGGCAGDDGNGGVGGHPRCVPNKPTCW